jgi:NitT/TauT family transport system ATP-binding protein
VFENVVFGARHRRLRPEEYEPRAGHLLEAVGLTGFHAHYPYQLSVGMRQRVQIARALLMNPEVILMDEPFGALDFQTRLTMQELVQTIWSEFRPTILFITHDVEEAVFLGDRVVVMSRRPGRIIEDIHVPFPKPRAYELTSGAPFQALKDRVLHLIRREGAPRASAASC